MPPPVRAAARTGATLTRVEDYFTGRFTALGSPCEVLVDGDDTREAWTALEIARAEAGRIERKFSRYRSDNLIHRINQARGATVPVDEETRLLLDYAVTCYEASGGMFDITSGVLRRAWTFDGSEQVPDEAAIAALREKVGWHRARWQDSELTLPAGMEIDLGGLGKEYAVDRAAALVRAEVAAPCLVNFGGDLFAAGPRRGRRPWGVGVDDPNRTGQGVLYRCDLTRGGLTTSGDARRFLRIRGRRYGHILDPRTGWPVEDAPRSVTVLASTCLEAGTLSTLACLQGPGAREFLAGQGVQFWVL